MVDLVLWRYYFFQIAESKSSKIDEITATITKAVQMCARCVQGSTDVCNCQVVVVINSESLICDVGGDKTAVIFSAYASDKTTIDAITKWTRNTDEIDVSGTKLLINKDCPVEIEMKDNARCKPPTSGQQSGSSNTAAVAASVVIILIVLGAVVLVLVTLFLFWRKRTGNSYNLFRFDNTQMGALLYWGHSTPIEHWAELTVRIVH